MRPEISAAAGEQIDQKGFVFAGQWTDISENILNMNVSVDCSKKVKQRFKQQNSPAKK